ncbi:MAG: hypothetical protein C5B50_23650 [Verrucomicrobia bacterium]|nr:MAG: hypothetical protein C5B50_23650 [Verrucomicrobiota bacterium]
MKIKLVTIVSASALLFATPCFARGDGQEESPLPPASPEDVIADTILVRPFCFVATVVGSALFIVSLPFAIPSKSVHRTAHALVAAPAYSTFKRPLGDLNDL